MSTSLAVGPFLIPGFILAVIPGYLAFRFVLSRMAQAFPEETAWVRDKGPSALLIAFLLWKLWPVFQWWPEISVDPIVLLRLPGGRSGSTAGAVGALVYLGIGVIRHRRRVVPLAASVSGLAVGFLFGLALLQTAAPDHTIPAGTNIQHLQVEYLASGGESSPLSRYSDRPTVITFWATWCGPCRAELPVKKRFYDEHKDVVNFVAVNMTATESSPAAVLNYVEKNGIVYPVALDRSGSLSNLFTIRGTPTTIVLATDGSISSRWTGPTSLDRINRAITQVR
jgi:thiol-disulfide isomerase/thioredoxin